MPRTSAHVETEPISDSDRERWRAYRFGAHMSSTNDLRKYLRVFLPHVPHALDANVNVCGVLFVLVAFFVLLLCILSILTARFVRQAGTRLGERILQYEGGPRSSRTDRIVLWSLI